MRPFGLMFHHFYDDQDHIKGQGAISSDDLRDLILYLKQKYNIVNAADWVKKTADHEWQGNEICLTFDDSLKCQYDIARPLLDEFGIKAFWFVYTSPLEGVLEKLEIYRHFRFKMFADIDDFYDLFFKMLQEGQLLDKPFEGYRREYEDSGFLKECLFYTENDRLYRFFRDKVLSGEAYNQLVEVMMALKKYDVEDYRNILWMSRENVKTLFSEGHVVGLHSHTHPTFISNLSFDEQLHEYETNCAALKEILSIAPYSVSYPCGRYNSDTETIMARLGVKLGFNSIMRTDGPDSPLHFPRLDHAYAMKEMRA